MSQYKYTKSGKVLTEEQRQFYEDNGYILFPKLVSDELLDSCRKTFIDICNGDDGVMIVMKDASLKNTNRKPEFIVNKIQDFLQNDSLFQYAIDKNVVDIVEDIIGPNITAMHSMLINKPPDSKAELSRHPLHQDLHYFPFRPADSIVASWTAMEKVDEKNGCLFVIPGSHKLELLRHEYPDGLTNYVYHGVKGYDHLPKKYVVMEKGDTIFFHPILLHGSGPNLTKGFRKAISVHYADSNCYFINVKGTTQENVASEIEDLMKKKGITMDYTDLWKMKSRLVRGNPGNFQTFSSHL